MTEICFCLKLFRSLQYSLPKICCLRLPVVLVNLRKISAGQNINLTENLHRLALISTPVIIVLWFYIMVLRKHKRTVTWKKCNSSAFQHFYQSVYYFSIFGAYVAFEHMLHFLPVVVHGFSKL